MAPSANQISSLRAPANHRATSKYQFGIPSKPELDLPIPLMGHTVVVNPKIEDQICNSEIRAVTTQNTILVFGGKMTASGTMEREDGSGASESTDFPMVLKAGLPFEIKLTFIR